VSKAKQPQTIPLYSCDGQMRDRISPERLAVLQGMGRIARVVTHRKGYINRAYLRPMPGEPKPSTLRDYTGTKYSFRQRLAGGHVAYRLRSLGDSAYASEVNLAPDEVRPIFLRVILDCMKPAGASGEASGMDGRPGRGDAPVTNVGAGHANRATSTPQSLGPTGPFRAGG
jgi:hypothetical protein